MKPLELSSQFGNSSNDSGSCPLGVLFYFAMGSHWPFGRFLCQVKIALLSSHFYGGTIFLTLICIHRYAAVVHFNRGSCMKQKGFGLCCSSSLSSSL
ncbi:hypothetical protein KUCAC02_032721 [Chaenocephalus aceratus]|nr:hypothetical protein KUCAC02_032721 [Chaenocephalus aceratus]